jgi:hypothetical protein
MHRILAFIATKKYFYLKICTEIEARAHLLGFSSIRSSNLDPGNRSNTLDLTMATRDTCKETGRHVRRPHKIGLFYLYIEEKFCIIANVSFGFLHGRV